MSTKLPMDFHDLLRQCIAEGKRIEYKAGYRLDHPRQCSTSKAFIGIR